jgi:hypothetical protein
MLRWLLLATLLAACATDTSTDPTGGGKADGSEPTITFAADFTQSASSQLLAGSPVRVRYSLDRVTECRTESGGNEAWGTSGTAQFDDGTQSTFAVSRIDGQRVVPVDAEVQLPASASSMAVYFTTSDAYGCVSYDSNFGSNYGFAIDRHGLGATFDFSADGSFSQSGAVHSGDAVVVHYDPARLAQCQAETSGNAAWGITLHWQVDGGAVHDAQAARPQGTDLVAADPIVTVPRGHDLAMWFEATSIYGCHAFDSANGANYHVTID